MVHYSPGSPVYLWFTFLLVLQYIYGSLFPWFSSISMVHYSPGSPVYLWFTFLLVLQDIYGSLFSWFSSISMFHYSPGSPVYLWFTILLVLQDIYGSKDGISLDSGERKSERERMREESKSENLRLDKYNIGAPPPI